MFWKIYFWISIVLLMLYYPSAGLSRIWEIINLVIDVLATVGLFGFCWEKKLFSKLFWKVFLPVCIIWAVVYSYFIPEPQKVYLAPDPEWFQLVDIIFSATWNILLFVALYLYAFRRTELWEQVEEKKDGT
jgi:hypothetical protein